MNKFQKLFNELQQERSLGPSNVNDHLMVFDGLNTFIRSFGATPAYNEDGDHVGGISGFLYSIGKQLEISVLQDVLLFLMVEAAMQKENEFTKITKQIEQIKLDCEDMIIMILH